MKTVAIDIDDVLVDSVTPIFNHYNKKYGTTLTKKDYYSKDIKVLGVSEYAVAAKRLEKYLASAEYTTLPPLAEAVRAIHRLSEQYRFVAVTSRPAFIEHATRAWLKKHFDDLIEDVIFTHFVMAADHSNHPSVSSKVDVCQRIGAAYMIDDHLHHAVPAASVVEEVFLIDQPWNQQANLPKNVSRVKDWSVIETVLLGGSDARG